jgi:ATP-dependent DNA ligase
MIVASNAATNRFAIPAIAFTCCTRAGSQCSVNCAGIKMPRSKWITSDVPLPVIEPLTLGRRPEPFSHPEWLFEVKWDGFRSLVKIEHGRCRLISRNGNEFKSFPDLALELPNEVSARSAILDGEIVCLDTAGKPQFRDLLFRRGEPRFVAFDLLWCDGQDLRYSALSERKAKLRSMILNCNQNVLYCDHVHAEGEKLFELVVEQDLEGIVAKRVSDPYLPEHTSWFKIRNRSYSQWAGRQQLFEKERKIELDFRVWEECTLACDVID